ncbi:MAG: CDP-alcohol phosphatidyltransferase family protein [Acidobacteriota bacterium]
MTAGQISPRRLLTWPNLLSAVRLAMVPLFIVLFLQGRARLAFSVFVIAGVTDWLDGLIARFWKQESTLGAYLDPAADKLLLFSAFVLLTISDAHGGAQMPWIVTLLVFVRDIMIVTGAWIYVGLLGQPKPLPRALSRWNMVIQLVALGVLLLSGLVGLFGALAPVAIGISLLMTVVSGLDYAYMFIILPIVQRNARVAYAPDASTTSGAASVEPAVGAASASSSRADFSP